MALIENVSEVIVRLKTGQEIRLTPSSVTKVQTRTEGADMTKHGSITYWHIIASGGE